MGLLGRAAVVSWSQVDPSDQHDFLAWHNQEHMPERIALPGFLRGRRYAAVRAERSHFILYETTDFDALVSPDYLERLNNPTPWTRRCVAMLRDSIRGLCTVRHSRGRGVGGFLATLRLHGAIGDISTLPALCDLAMGLPQVVGAHLVVADAHASGIETAERRGRRLGTPTAAVLVEGTSAAAVDDAAENLCRRLPASPPAARPAVDIHQLQFLMTTR